MGQGGDIVGLFAFHINHVISNSRRSSRKEVVHAITINDFSSDIGCGKDLADGEKVLVIKEIAKVKTNKSFAERINRCVMTEIGESVRIFVKILQKNPVNLFSMRDMNRLKENVDRMPGATSGIIFNEASLPNKA